MRSFSKMIIGCSLACFLVGCTEGDNVNNAAPVTSLPPPPPKNENAKKPPTSVKGRGVKIEGLEKKGEDGL